MKHFILKIYEKYYYQINGFNLLIFTDFFIKYLIKSQSLSFAFFYYLF